MEVNPQIDGGGRLDSLFPQSSTKDEGLQERKIFIFLRKENLCDSNKCYNLGPF